MISANQKESWEGGGVAALQEAAQQAAQSVHLMPPRLPTRYMEIYVV